jgi:hypothetical protein
LEHMRVRQRNRPPHEETSAGSNARSFAAPYLARSLRLLTFETNTSLHGDAQEEMLD